jgi:hypothetical protein
MAGATFLFNGPEHTFDCLIIGRYRQNSGLPYRHPEVFDSFGLTCPPNGTRCDAGGGVFSRASLFTRNAPIPDTPPLL